MARFRSRHFLSRTKDFGSAQLFTEGTGAAVPPEASMFFQASPAVWIASMMWPYPVQRHRWPSSALATALTIVGPIVLE